MGMIVKISCKCGYSKKLYCGAGIAACNINMLNKLFPSQIISEFEEYKSKDMVKTFIMENEITYCKQCKDINTTCVLKYELQDGKKIERINKCNRCYGDVEILDYNNLLCPNCANKLLIQEVGSWD